MKIIDSNLLHANASEKSNLLFRRLILGLWLIIIALEPMADYSFLPHQHIQPTNILMHMVPHDIWTSILTYTNLMIIKCLTILFLICSLFSIFLRSSLILSCFFLTFQQAFYRSHGHIGHEKIVLLIIVYVITLFVIADSIEKKSKNTSDNISTNLNALPLLISALVLSFTYTFIGLNRLLVGGFSLFTPESIDWWILYNYKKPILFGIDFNQLYFTTNWIRFMFHVGCPAMCLYEILAPFVVVSRYFRYSFILVMGSFHVLSWWFLGIFFPYTLIIYFILFDFSRREEKLLNTKTNS